MGLSPRSMDELSLFELECMAKEWRRQNKRDDAKPPAMDDETLASLGIEGF